MFRAGLYARVSTNDQQTLAMQNRAMREYAARRGWTIALQVPMRGVQLLLVPPGIRALHPGRSSASQTLQPRGLHQLGHYTGAPASLGKSATRLRGFNGHEARSGTLPEGASGYPSDQQ